MCCRTLGASGSLWDCLSSPLPLLPSCLLTPNLEPLGLPSYYSCISKTIATFMFLSCT